MGKLIQIDWSQAVNFDDEELFLYQLTDRQAMLLLGQTDYLAWKTRYKNLLIPESELLEIRDRINYQLMTPQEASMFDCTDVENCLETSIIVNNIETNITTVQGDVTNVTNTVNNHTTEITNLTENVTEITENSTYNEYPEYPDPSEALQDFCGSAHAIANYLNDFIQDVITDAQTITLQEFFTAILGLGGFKTSIVKVLWDYVISNLNPNLSTEVSNAIPYVAQAFFCNQLNPDLAKVDIIADANITSDAEATYVSAIDALTVAKFSELIFLGSLDDSQDCASFACGCSEYDFTKGLHGWTPVTNIQVAGKGLRTTTGSAGRFEFITMTHYFTVTQIQIDYLLEGAYGSFRDIDLSYYLNGSQFGTTHGSPNLGLTQGTLFYNVNAPNCNGLRFFIRNSGGSASGEMYVQRLRLIGTPITGRPQNSAPSC